MKKTYITILLAGSLSSTAALGFSPTVEPVTENKQFKAAVSIGVQVNYLGEPVSGVTVNIIQDGKTLGSANTDNRGEAKISVADYNNRPVILELKKDGYQTQIMNGLLLKKWK